MVVNNKESDSCFLGDGREGLVFSLPISLSLHFPLPLSPGFPYFSKWPMDTIPYLTLLYSKEAAAR